MAKDKLRPRLGSTAQPIDRRTQVDVLTATGLVRGNPLDGNRTQVQNVGEPSAKSDAATKNYVDTATKKYIAVRYASAAQTWNSTSSNVNFDTADHDPEAGWDTGNKRWVFPASGLWRMHFWARVTNSNAAQYNLSIVKVYRRTTGGTTTILAACELLPLSDGSGAGEWYLKGGPLIYTFDKGDQIYCLANETTGNNLTLAYDVFGCRLEIESLLLT